jgi:hemoglobin-like flavoprotein
VKNLKKMGVVQHAVRLLNLLDAVLCLVGPPDTLFGMLEDVGRRHAKLYSVVKADHVALMGESFVRAMREWVKNSPDSMSSWTPDLEHAWQQVWDVIVGRIIKGIIQYNDSTNSSTNGTNNNP